VRRRRAERDNAAPGGCDFMENIYTRMRNQRYYRIGVLAAPFAALCLISLYAVFAGQQAYDGLHIAGGLVQSVDDASPAYSAGIRRGDRIVKIGNVLFHKVYRGGSMAESIGFCQENCAGLIRAGEAVTYTVFRDSAFVALDVVPVRTGLAHIGCAAAVRIIAGVFFLCIGVFVFLRRPGDAAARLFVLYCAAEACYGVLGYYSPFWDFRIISFLIYAIPPVKVISAVLCMHFLYRLTLPPHIQIRRAALAAWYALGSAVIVAYAAVQVWYAHHVDTACLVRDSYYYASYCMGIVVAALNYFRYKNSAAYSLVRQQVKVIVYGVAASVGLFLLYKVFDMASDGAYVNFISEGEQIFFTMLFLLIPISIAFSIVRLGLFEIDKIINKSIKYLVFAAVYFTLFFALFLAARSVFENIFFNSPLLSAGFSFILVFVCQMIFQNQLEDFVDRVFFSAIVVKYESIDRIIDTIYSFIRLDDILEYLPPTMERILDAGYVRMFLVRPEKRDRYFLHHPAGMENDGFPLTSVAASDDVVRWMREEHRVVPIEYFDNLSDIIDERNERLVRELGAAAFAPLFSKRRMIGFIVVGKKNDGSMYNYYDIDFIARLLNSIALSIENIFLINMYKEEQILKNEIRIAKDMQRQLLPQRIPAVSRYDIAASIFPASEMCGDFYDFIYADDDRVDFILSDVSGKGLPAAFYGALLSGIVHSHTLPSMPPDKIISSWQDIILKKSVEKIFIAACYGILKPNENALEFVNAGLLYPVLSSSASTAYVELGGLPLGTRLKTKYSVKRVPFEKGDVMVFCSDGVVEAAKDDRRFFGFDRLIDVIGNCRQQPAEGVLNGIINAVWNHIGNTVQNDDITIIVIKRTG